MSFEISLLTFLIEERPFTSYEISEITNFEHEKVKRTLRKWEKENKIVRIPNIAGDMRQPLFTINPTWNCEKCNVAKNELRGRKK